jgi:TPR repeat protein
MSHKMGFTCPRIWNKLPPRCFGMWRVATRCCFDPKTPTLKMTAPFSFTRSALLVAGLLALWGSAAAQTPTQGDAATNSAPRGVLPLPSPSGSSVDDSIDTIRRSAEAGNPLSQVQLGNAFSSGDGVSKDDVEAAKWYRKAADQGYSLGQESLGACYYDGSGVGKDLAEAAKWFQKAADQGEAGAQWGLGKCYANGPNKDVVEAAKWYRKAADQGLALAQVYLGMCYHNGNGVDQDEGEAAKWYRKAADQGNAEAQFQLGLCYLFGNGVEKDEAKAVEWCQKAADQGDARAQLALGLCYRDGTGVEKNATVAATWFGKAAEQGNAHAECELGTDYAAGNGVQKDNGEAFNLFRKAADQGYALAQLDLGNCYSNGYGVRKDVVEAATWYQKAAGQGDATAQLILGDSFIRGRGVIKNEVEGLAWLYVCSAAGSDVAGRMVSTDENIYSTSTIEAARQRATELQAQIVSYKAGQADSTTATVQPASAANTPKSSGSGAFISADGLVLTAAHVIQGASRIQVVTAAGMLAATVVKIDATNDVALLKCTGSNFTPLPIAPSKESRAGTTVFTVGFPNIQIQGFDPKLTKGEISSQTGFQDDPREWQISVPIQPGNSGGPLCDENGNLIGIVEATLNPLTMAKIAGEIPQDVNYAVKSSYILPLLDDVQNLPSPHPSTESTKFEDVVGNVQKSAVLILVY